MVIMLLGAYYDTLGPSEDNSRREFKRCAPMLRLLSILLETWPRALCEVYLMVQLSRRVEHSSEFHSEELRRLARRR